MAECHGLVPWLLTFASDDRHVSSQREQPRHEAVALKNTVVQPTFFSFTPLDGAIFSPV
jgi:hypothetical protein